MNPKKPKKPRKPSAPPRPKEVLEKHIMITEWVQDRESYSLEDVLPDGVPLSQIFLVIDHEASYDYEGCSGASMFIVYDIQNPNLEKDNQIYEAKLKEYLKKMSSYEEKLKDYEVKMQKWKLAVAPQLLSDAEKKRDKLQSELKKLEKKIEDLK